MVGERSKRSVGGDRRRGRRDCFTMVSRPKLGMRTVATGTHVPTVLPLTSSRALVSSQSSPAAQPHFLQLVNLLLHMHTISLSLIWYFSNWEFLIW
jgi:hypothetical protein